MKKWIRKLEDSMAAAAFAEAGEFEAVNLKHAGTAA